MCAAATDSGEEAAAAALAHVRVKQVVQAATRLERERSGRQDLPPITIGKVPCRLTVEQASLYSATVDRWLPRIEMQSSGVMASGPARAITSKSMSRTTNSESSGRTRHAGSCFTPAT